MTTQKATPKIEIIKTVLLACILILLVVGFILLAAQFSEVKACLDTVEQDLRQINVDEINAAVTALKEAAGLLADVDIDSLNGTITSLQSAADTLKDVDIDALNGLVGSLQTVAEKLQSAVNAISSIKNIFGG